MAQQKVFMMSNTNTADNCPEGKYSVIKDGNLLSRIHYCYNGFWHYNDKWGFSHRFTDGEDPMEWAEGTYELKLIADV